MRMPYTRFLNRAYGALSNAHAPSQFKDQHSLYPDGQHTLACSNKPPIKQGERLLYFIPIYPCTIHKWDHTSNMPLKSFIIWKESKGQRTCIRRALTTSQYSRNGTLLEWMKGQTYLCSYRTARLACKIKDPLRLRPSYLYYRCLGVALNW